MNISFRSTLVSLAILGAAVGLQAQATPKVATVDMEVLFKKYYKTEIQETAIKDAEKKAKDQVERLKKDGEALVTEAKALQEQTQNAILSDEARKKAQSDLEAKVAQIREKETEIQGFVQRVQQSFQQQLGKFQQQAGEEISKVAGEIAKAKGANLVINSSASMVVVFVDSSFDITDEVLTAINKDRPPSITVTTPAAPAK